MTKRYRTWISIALPVYQIEVDSWEEAEAKAQELLQRVDEIDRGTSSVNIAPLEKIQG